MQLDIKRAEYGVVVKFGTLDDLKDKLNQESKSIKDVIDKVDVNNISLLHNSLISRKFDIALYLLQEGAKVNVLSKEGCNEMHFIASNINNNGAIELARMLIERGVDLNQIDYKYANTALFTLCLELLKKQSPEGLQFIKELLTYSINIDITNKSGNSTRKLLNDRSTDEIRGIILSIQ